MTTDSSTTQACADDYRMQVLPGLREVDAATWDRLATHEGRLQPFLRHAFLLALESSGCVGGQTGWDPRHLLLSDPQGDPVGAVPLYAKHHSYGEYVFDWAWADAYQRHGLDYYPKLLSAIPFSPVAGSRLLAVQESIRPLLAQGLLQVAKASEVSSLHVLFPDEAQADALERAGMMLRRGVQFHWHNQDYADFDHFLENLTQPKRKKIRAERRKVREAGVTVRRIPGAQIQAADWAFFNRCYRMTYRAHQSTPYLNLAFFHSIGATMPDNLLLIIAERAGQPIASSLIMLDQQRLYGRYWGALEHVPCLHFELAYYQTIEAAIERQMPLIEGGAQGEHKMARGFVPVQTVSAHWLSEPAFAQAVEQFLKREGTMIDGYLDELAERTPFRDPGAPPTS